jgi:hypothetical protein
MTTYAGPAVRPTDFARFPHVQLVQMLAASNPNAVVAAADEWSQVAAALHAHADELDRGSGSIRNMWAGTAADQFQTMVGGLSGGVRRVAAAALAVRDLVYLGGEALHEAWLRMPAPGDEVAHAEAVAVLTELAARYRDLYAQIPAALRAAVSPGGAGAGGTDRFGSLFGDLMPAGLASAAAALGSQFNPADLTGDGKDPATPAQPTPPGSATAHGAGPRGARPRRRGRCRPGQGGNGWARRRAAEALPRQRRRRLDRVGRRTGTRRLDGGQRRRCRRRGGQGRWRRGTPDADGHGWDGRHGDAGGNGRRLPPWLVETEDIWGESAAMVPGVIGE